MSKKKPVMSHDPLAGLVEETGVEADAGLNAETATAADAGTGEGKPGSVLKLPSSLTIAELGELHPVLAERLQQGNDLSIDCSQIELVDGAGLQLLAALNKSAVERQVSISWHGATEVLVQAIAELGLNDLLEVA